MRNQVKRVICLLLGIIICVLAVGCSRDTESMFPPERSTASENTEETRREETPAQEPAAEVTVPEAPEAEPEDEKPEVFEDTELTAVLQAEELAELDIHYPKLEKLDLTGSLCIDEILEYVDSHPEVVVTYTVPIGEREIPADTEEFVCESDWDIPKLLATAGHFKNMRKIDLSAVSYTEDMLAELRQLWPEVSLKYNVRVLGTEYPMDTEKVDLVGIKPEQVETVCDQLRMFGGLQEINLMDEAGNCELSFAELREIAAAAPGAGINYAFELFGKEVNAADERLEYKNVRIRNAGADTLREVLPFMNKLNYVLLDNCSIDYEICAQLRDEFPEKHVVWRVYLRDDGKSLLTDVELVWAIELTESYARNLKYFTNVRYLDVGHSSFRTVDFLNYMPNLEVAILAINFVTDISPIVNCPNLEYLELFSSSVSDLTPLASLKKLEHLNISNLYFLEDISCLYDMTSLKRLRASLDRNVPQEQKDEIIRRLPDCVIEFGYEDPTAGTWRYDSNYQYVERYKLLREQIGYDLGNNG